MMLLYWSRVLMLLQFYGTVHAISKVASPPSDILKLDVRRLVIDTDAGVDDAVGIMEALGYEHFHGKVDVVAITCVSGNTPVDNVVVNVLKTLDTADRLDVPVYRGATTPLHVPRASDEFFGKDGFGDVQYPNPPSVKRYLQKKHAVIALIDLVTKYPGEISILCLGPLTNIALAIRLEPAFLSKVRHLVVIGGSVEGYGNVLPGIEFNFYADPEATFIVFSSIDTRVANVKPVILVPWESAAKRNSVPIEWRKKVLGSFSSPQVKLMNKIERKGLEGQSWSCIDAIASAVALNSSIVTSVEKTYLQVQADGQHAGAVFVDYQNSSRAQHNVIIVKNINVDVYLEMLLESLG